MNTENHNEKAMQFYIWKDSSEDYSLHTAGMALFLNKDKPKLNYPPTQNNVIYGLDRPMTLLYYKKFARLCMIGGFQKLNSSPLINIVSEGIKQIYTLVCNQKCRETKRQGRSG